MTSVNSRSWISNRRDRAGRSLLLPRRTGGPPRPGQTVAPDGVLPRPSGGVPLAQRAGDGGESFRGEALGDLGGVGRPPLERRAGAGGERGDIRGRDLPERRAARRGQGQ